jgi:hypothetical protein
MVIGYNRSVLSHNKTAPLRDWLAFFIKGNNNHDSFIVFFENRVGICEGDVRGKYDDNQESYKKERKDSCYKRIVSHFILFGIMNSV